MDHVNLTDQQFKSSAERIYEFKKYDRNKMLNFGIDFLDGALRFIFPDDLILFGAMPGAGKTQQAVNIAITNALLGKRIHLFALEASKNEIENRMFYSLTAKNYYNAICPKEFDRPLNYEDWLADYFGDDLLLHEEAARNQILKLNNLHTFYRDEKEFTSKTLSNMALAYAGETDLIIVDHVHYFDFVDDDENKALHDIIKTARNIVLRIGKPMIMIAHLRKRDRFTDLIPGIYEFHGSSNLPKIATRVICMAPGGPVENEKYKFYTYIRIGKNRFNNSISNYIGKTIYDIRTNSYDKVTQVGKLSLDGKSFETLSEREVPFWVKK